MSAAPDQAALKVGNVFWLLAAMAFVIAPHTERLPLWVTGTCVLVGMWRGLIAWHGWKMPHWAIVASLALAATAGTWISHDKLYGRDPSSTLLIVMVCLKLLEMKSRRDSLLTVFLGFFLVFTNFLYSQTIAMGAYMLVCVWVFMATLVGFNRIGTEASIRERILPAAKIVAQAIPLMLVIFVLFPRVTTPLWRLPQDSNSGLTGLSDTMSPGDLNRLIQSEKVAFRADFSGPIPRNDALYWRGPVLWDFDGRTWRMIPFAGVYSLEKSGIEPRGQLVDYAVTLEPHGKNWLFALDMPSRLPPATQLHGDYQLRATSPVNNLRRYEVQSALDYRAMRPLTRAARERLTAVPLESNPRAAAFAQRLRLENPDDRALINATLRLFNSQFIYTLEPPALGAAPVDEFLFETKRGFCEHYASAFVYLMRAAGIPARVVTGYQGGEVNTIGNYLVVRQADAHAWTEVWLEGEGWVRTDPTAAVAPSRIQQGMDMALGPVGVIPNLIAADKLGILRQALFAWDAFNNQWNQWVVGYNPERQARFLQQFGIDATDWKKVAVWLLAGSLTVGGTVALFILWQRRGHPADPALQAFRRFSRKMGKLGIQRSEQEGPLDFLRRIERERPDLASAARQVIELYIRLRYAPPDGMAAESLKTLRQSVANIRATPR